MFKRVWLLFVVVMSLSPNLSSSAQPETAVASPTEFERLLVEARAGRIDSNEVWPVFLNTTFFVAVDKTPGTTSDVGFILFPSPKNPEIRTVLISEDPHRLEKVCDSALKMK